MTSRNILYCADNSAIASINIARALASVAQISSVEPPLNDLTQSEINEIFNKVRNEDRAIDVIVIYVSDNYLDDNGKNLEKSWEDIFNRRMRNTFLFVQAANSFFEDGLCEIVILFERAIVENGNAYPLVQFVLKETLTELVKSFPKSASNSGVSIHMIEFPVRKDDIETNRLHNTATRVIDSIDFIVRYLGSGSVTTLD